MKEFRTKAYCSICEAEKGISAPAAPETPDASQAIWFRNRLRCDNCGAPPRQRAIAEVLNKMRPNWRALDIHECSPGAQGFSAKLKRECRGYVATQYDPAIPFGQQSSTGEWRNENLEAQTFEDDSFDVVVTQDVFEHLFDPGEAAREILRTLKPGGIVLMTVPVVRGFGATQRRARLTAKGVEHLLPEQYHGNPVGDGRALVTVDWSYDIGAYLTAATGVGWTVMVVDDMSRAIRDPFNAILIARKPAQRILPD